MWTLVLAILQVVSASEFEQLENSNGWIPVSSDIVYQQIRHGFTPAAPPYTQVQDVDTLQTNIPGVFSQDYKDEELKEGGTGQDLEKYYSEDDAANNLDDNIKNRSISDSEDEFVSKKIFTPPAKPTESLIRNSKKIRNFDTGPAPKSQNVNVFAKNSNVTRAYEVTELNNIEDEAQQETVLETSGYEYNPPHAKSLTNDLISSLTKYNIKENDYLQNYALSRRLKFANVIKPNKPVHLRAPVGYNNLNHLPVDPLLAVFLSNYGYYLQGQYGIRNNYKNLYGYLASNNIHNNRPFGHYKVFSDTDSFQK